MSLEISGHTVKAGGVQNCTATTGSDYCPLVWFPISESKGEELYDGYIYMSL